LVLVNSTVYATDVIARLLFVAASWNASATEAVAPWMIFCWIVTPETSWVRATLIWALTDPIFPPRSAVTGALCRFTPWTPPMLMLFPSCITFVPVYCSDDQPFPGLLTVTVFPETVGIPDTEELRFTCWVPATIVAVTPVKVVPSEEVATVVPVEYVVVKFASGLVADSPLLIWDMTR
jgi:hypothetical protein